MSLKPYFQQAIEKKASDLYIISGLPPVFRVSGKLIKAGGQGVSSREIEGEFLSSLSQEKLRVFKESGDLDLSLSFFEHRFRINLHYQSGQLAVAARVITNTIPTPKELGLDENLEKWSQFHDGLILVTGPTGSGKSTTLASLIDLINKTRGGHIITIEDPIEYIFPQRIGIVEQREVGQDTESFQSALKYVLRQDPNTIMVGEMRDLETIAAALTAAETGHLVLSTLHTITAAETVERIVDVFPANQQNQILIQLASVLRVVVSQRLLPRVGGGLVAGYEVLINNQAVSSLIRSNKANQIYSTIQTGTRDGMITMTKSLEGLIKNGVLDAEIAAPFIKRKIV